MLPIVTDRGMEAFMTDKMQTGAGQRAKEETMTQQKRTSTITVQNRVIGEGYPAYIIAEMSANHAGSMERAKEIIHAAKEAGADCIKIQTYTPDTLTIDCDKPYFQIGGGTWSGETLYGLYGKAYTPWEWQPLLKEEADKAGIHFLSTPFDKTAVDFLEEMGCACYKIASFEMVDLPLITYIASKQKSIIMSTGMGKSEEIEEAIQAIYKTGNHQAALLKCSSAYPAKPEQMNLRTIADMKERFGTVVGLSDHSMGSLSAATSVALGGSIIEKHFCLGREIKNPDSSFSMTPKEFAQMVRDVRAVQAAIGNVFYGPAEQEKENLKFRRSIFAVQDIHEGEVFTEQNIRSIRPSDGLEPKYYGLVLGRRAACDVSRGEPLAWKHVEGGREVSGV